MNLFPKKIWLCILLTAGLMIFSGTSTYAQEISLSKSEFTLEELFSEIRKQTGYDFLFTSSQLNIAKKVKVDAKDAPLKKILDQALAGLNISYVIRNKTISIVDKRAVPDQDQIQGFVGDKSDKKAIPGVTVLIKGTNSAVQTNKDGRFSISLPPGSKSLEFRYLGYKTTELTIAANMEYIVYLEEDQQMLQETVITGFGERKIESYTGAQKQMTGAELRNISNTNVLTGIQALDPSFRIVPNNAIGGDINATPEIQVRGANGFPNLTGELAANPNQPLVVLDGFDSNLRTIMDLDINLIDKVTILKDASATSIYGSRGANGVIIVTTRTPVAGKVQVDFSNTSVLTAPDLSVYNLLDAKDKLAFEQRAGVYSPVTNDGGVVWAWENVYANRYKMMTSGVNTKWINIPVQNGFSNNTSLNLSGGDQAIRYQLNFNGNPQSGVMKGQDRTNLNGQFNLNYVLKKVRFSNQVMIGQLVSNASPYGSFSQYVGLNPYWAPRNADGTTPKAVESLVFSGYGPGTTANPLYNAELNSINKTREFSVQNNFNFDYQPLQNSRIFTSISLRRSKGNTDNFVSAENTQFDNTSILADRGRYIATNINNTSLQSRTSGFITLTYGPHQIQPSVLLNVISTSSDSQTLTATGFPFDRLDNLLFASQYQANSKPTGTEDTQHSLSYGGALSYTYDQRYSIEANINREGASAYGDLSRWGTFWSVGTLWNVHNEKFLKDNELINTFRLRATYGYTGSAGRDAYASQFRYAFGVNTQYYGELGATLTNLGNPNLGWQTVRKINVGANFEMLNSRLNGNIDLYRENTQNAIQGINLAPTTGFPTFQENIGKIRNTGMSADVRYTVVNRGNIFWSIGINGAANRNVLEEFSPKFRAINDVLAQRAAAAGNTRPNPQLQEGQSMSALYVVRSLGIDPTTGAEVYLKNDGTRTFVWNPGDLVAVGDTNPDWIGTINTNFRYKGLELGVNFGYEYGAEVYNSTLVDRVENVDVDRNVDRRAFDLGWSGPGSVSQYRRIGTTVINTQSTSRFVQRDNQLNITSLSLTYDFGRNDLHLIKKIGLNNLRINAQTNNLANFRTMAMERGTDNPFSRVYNIRISTRF